MDLDDGDADAVREIHHHPGAEDHAAHRFPPQCEAASEREEEQLALAERHHRVCLAHPAVVQLQGSGGGAAHEVARDQFDILVVGSAEDDVGVHGASLRDHWTQTWYIDT